MSFRRGFKAEAEWYALEFRKELNLTKVCPLDPFVLAEKLSIPVMTLSSFANEAPAAVGHFSGEGEGALSGMTVFRGNNRAIIYNDNHPKGRCHNSIAHELSHGILGHPPSPPMCDLGLRNYDDGIEKEADFLAAAILIPKTVAIYILSTAMDKGEAAEHYGVSAELLRWRIGISGAQHIHRRRQLR